ncbi:hypothetical protein N234_06415 [Ralstonia pickettii DTP0602]|nr:hypothetical protein N234_06415 [Ralstonia pickettii DTP0602]
MERRIPPLATRLVPPRTGPRSVPREALVQRLHHGRHGKLVLLTAAAGYGKTTALAQWRQRLAADGARVAWLSLGPDDDVLEGFCAALLACLHRAGIVLRQPGLAHPDSACDTPAVAAAVISALAGVPGELYLMLDEFDHVREPATVDFMQALLAARLPGLHVVAASRRECKLALGRLRAMGELAEFSCTDLAFSLPETRAFLRHRTEGRIAQGEGKGRAADADLAVRLHDATAGWPTGLGLAAALPTTTPETPASGAGWPAAYCAALHAYWSEEVTAGLPPELLTFLQRLSVLDRFNADLAAAVTGSNDAAGLLADIRARGLFLRRVATPGTAPDGVPDDWYRLHPLFAAHLRHLLVSANGDLEVLHWRAAAWLREQSGRDYLSDAIGHALKSGDFEAVRSLMESLASDLPGISQLRSFMRWVDAIDADRLAMHPSLLEAAAWSCTVSARPKKAEDWIRRWQSANADVQAQGSVPVTLMRAIIALHEDDPDRAMALLATLSDAPLGRPVLETIRSGLALRCGTMLGEHPRALPRYRALVPTARQGSTEFELMGAGAVAMAAWLEGDALEALRLGAAPLAASEQQFGRYAVGTSRCAVPVAAALYELDRADDAREVLAGRLDALRFSTPDVLIEAAVCHARLQCLADAPHDALVGLVETEVLFHRRGLPRGVARMLAEQLRLALLGKDLRHADRLQRALDELAAQYSGNSPRDQRIAATAAMTRARLALIQAAPERALAALDGLRALPAASVRESLMVTADLLQAHALDDLGRTNEATTFLTSAVAAGQRLGLVRTLADEGGRVQELLGRLARSTNADPSCFARPRSGNVPAAGRGSPAPMSPAKPLPPSDTGMGKALTRREREILALLEQSMSNKHIALVLNLSVDTVKWNLRQIFGKLGVSRRYEAILVARSAAQRMEVDTGTS